MPPDEQHTASSAAAQMDGVLSFTPMLTPNSILQNRYRIVRLLGEGGMGAVYEAIDQRVSCLVAVKETLVGSSPEARQAFQREAALLANLRQPALPKVMDYFGEGEGEFLVMEFILGHDLAELLALRDGPFPQEQVVRWANEILKLLEYLHTREPPIIHRDIKPANLKVTSQGEVFLLDFGLAKGAAGQMATIQTSHSVRGYTPVYAPLEQIHGRGTDPRTDLYALAATMYHLLTGQAPLGAPTRFDLVESGRPDPLKPASKLNSLVTSGVAALVQSAMALSRHDRPSSAAEMRLALQEATPESAEARTVRDEAEAVLIEIQPERSEADSAKPLFTDKDVLFTVFSPQKIKPEKIYPVLAFAHLSKRRADAAEDERDPIEEMKDQAARILGAQRDDYGDVKDASRLPVPRGGELTFVPIVQGLTFSPASRNFTWRKSVHREEFDMWASRDVDGQTLKGRLTVFLGSLVIAEIELSISIDSHAVAAAEKISLEAPQSARRVRQVFASYSHSDEQVVAELAHVAPIFGSRFLMDRTHLEPGEDRREGLQRLIRDADVFQLFWSTNSMRSSETVDEIKYAASLGRTGFILPTYWEEPLPRSPAEGLPPPEIERLHFYRIYPGVISHATFGRGVESPPATRAADTMQALPLTIGSPEPRDDTPTGKLAPMLDTIPAPEAAFADAGAQSGPAVGAVVCRKCGTRYAAGVRFCGHCGNADFEQASAGVSMNQPMAPAALVSSPPQSSAPMAVARRRKGMMIPIFAGAAVVLFAVILAPIWFMMSSRSTTYDTRPASANRSNPAPLATLRPNTNASSTNASSSQSPPPFTNSSGIEFVYVPSGTFMMGSNNGDADEKPVHQVTIKEGFYLGRYEVTQAEWKKVMGKNPSHFKGDRLPVETVSWDDAQDFIKKLLNERGDAVRYRLPTEAEWEYACRAGTTGDFAGSLDAMAWVATNSSDTTHPVGTKQANAFGLSDMHGNVGEWCEDWYHDTYSGAPTDGSGWLTGGAQTGRVVRGGSWFAYTYAPRSANRTQWPGDHRGMDLGFRVVAFR